MSTPNDLNWNDLLLRAKAGNDRAMDELFLALTVRLTPIVQSRLRGWPTAAHEDILQNTLLVVAEKIADVKENPHHFALVILRNKIGDALRQRAGNRMETLQEEPSRDDDRSKWHRLESQNPDPHEEIDRKGLTEKILQVIPKLSAFCQSFFLAALNGRDIGEIWEMALGTEPELKRATFDKRIFDCRKRLKQEVRDYLTP